jgi:hypothetical protein
MVSEALAIHTNARANSEAWKISAFGLLIERLARNREHFSQFLDSPDWFALKYVEQVGHSDVIDIGVSSYDWTAGSDCRRPALRPFGGLYRNTHFRRKIWVWLDGGRAIPRIMRLRGPVRDFKSVQRSLEKPSISSSAVIRA